MYTSHKKNFSEKSAVVKTGNENRRIGGVLSKGRGARPTNYSFQKHGHLGSLHKQVVLLEEKKDGDKSWPSKSRKWQGEKLG